jgi:Nickel responsive protein SCO4226-like
MALFMDVHDIEGGVEAVDVAAAHEKDLQVGERYGAKFLQYWVNEPYGKIFCLVEAASAEDAIAVHREAHGLVADAVYPVIQG